MRDLKKFTVFAGQVVITSAPALITTVLGSCVSVCLWDSTTRFAGMNHYLLPGTSDDKPDNGNRGITSIPLLVKSFINRNINIGGLEAKVFGGCNSLYQNADFYKIGERNVATAIEILKSYNIKITAQHTGGQYGRKIVMNSTTGKVQMRLLIKRDTINEEINKGFGY
jgi:chemotaxis protein CheD